MQGVVTKSTGSWYTVLFENGQQMECRLKGKFRLDGIKHTNPIAVGDKVTVEQEPDEETGVIIKLTDRHNYIIRKSNNLSKQTQVLAANMDQAMLIVTLFFPRTSSGFMDRFLVTAEAYHIPVTIVFNKIDLYGEEALTILAQYEKLYQSLGYKTLRTSAAKRIGIDEFRQVLKDKTTLLAGHSGVGKSSLINCINPEIAQRVGAVSNYSEKGMHTTTFAEMFELLPRTFIIDTPGIKDLGLVDIKEQELSHYFPEMRELINECRFNNCKHLNEPGCAVLRALEEGHIDEERYINYLSMLRNEDIHH
ncbi:MAG TPA: ribosome small subunit-dependent GTPase A [Bacteroidia bacterium]|nr:ribosome small subunit-dependent GTPase A [Bacteroidia bacterium]